MPEKRPPARKEGRASKIFNTVKDAARADMQLWNMSSVIHIITPTVPDQKPKAPKDKKPKKKTKKKEQKRTVRAPPERPLVVEDRVADQSGSKLLQLSIEIRKRIWVEAFGRNMFFGGGVVDFQSSYIYRSSNDFVYYSAEWPRKSIGVLNTMLTCRQM